MIELGKREIGMLKLADPNAVVDGAVVRTVKAYPVYDDAYAEAVTKVRTWLEGLGNLQLIGRNGMHRYNSQDHSMLTAMLAAHNILGGDFDPWRVDVDQKHYEEVRADYLSDLIHIDETQPLVPVESADQKSLADLRRREGDSSKYM